MSSKPNLWHQNLSFTIRLFFHATYEVTKPKGSEFLSFAAFIRRFISPLRFCIFFHIVTLPLVGGDAHFSVAEFLHWWVGIEIGGLIAKPYGE